MHSFQYKNIKITKFPQSGFLLEFQGKNIYIDPFRLAQVEESGEVDDVLVEMEGISVPSESEEGDEAASSKVLPPADFIFLTHDHFDHADAESINMIITPETMLIANELAVGEILEDVEFGDLIQVSPDEKYDLEIVKFETVPAYNIDKFRDEEKNEVYHPRQNKGVGYIFHLGKNDIYHMGDTDNVPEIGKISGVDVVLVPISGTYVMTAREAAECISALAPEIVVPMHHDARIVGGPKSLEKFKKELKDLDKKGRIEVKDLSWEV